MSTHNMCFYKENQKKKKENTITSHIKASFDKSFTDLCLSVPLVLADTYFTTSFLSNFVKPKHAVR